LRIQRISYKKSKGKWGEPTIIRIEIILFMNIAEQPFIVRAYNAIDFLVVMNELPLVAAGCPPVYLVRN
jgi:hypothetical protein